mmetsp:Transcript_58009/g.126823  ORF Transcript_58009/g.126823 Transcript_58009/m.126823 type:complete len:203 (+) Transcript_58009:172-780(+)
MRPKFLASALIVAFRRQDPSAAQVLLWGKTQQMEVGHPLVLDLVEPVSPELQPVASLGKSEQLLALLAEVMTPVLRMLMPPLELQTALVLDQCASSEPTSVCPLQGQAAVLVGPAAAAVVAVVALAVALRVVALLQLVRLSLVTVLEVQAWDLWASVGAWDVHLATQRQPARLIEQNQCQSPQQLMVGSKLAVVLPWLGLVG